MVAALALGASGFDRVGSSPTVRTILKIRIVGIISCGVQPLGT